jgi:hypothetical protein
VSCVDGRSHGGVNIVRVQALWGWGCQNERVCYLVTITIASTKYHCQHAKSTTTTATATTTTTTATTTATTTTTTTTTPHHHHHYTTHKPAKSSSSRPCPTVCEAQTTRSHRPTLPSSPRSAQRAPPPASRSEGSIPGPGDRHQASYKSQVNTVFARGAPAVQSKHRCWSR